VTTIQQNYEESRANIMEIVLMRPTKQKNQQHAEEIVAGS